VDAVLAMLVPMLLGTGGAIWSAMQWRRARAFEDTPTSRVRSAAQGYVELAGVARALPGDPTHSPLTGRSCVWYKYSVEERSSSSSREEWHTIDSGICDETFAIEDATGQATVNPEGADVTALDKDVWYGNTPRTPPALRPWRVFGGIGNRYRYTEYVILDGQPLAAVGFFRTERAGDQVASLDTELALRLRDWKKDPERMRRIDADRDGRISADEWEQARNAARDEIVQELREQAAMPGWSVLQKPVDGRPFLLGTGTVKELAGRYRRNAWGVLAISVLLWGVGLYQA
jgi:hypothetical protein